MTTDTMAEIALFCPKIMLPFQCQKKTLMNSAKKCLSHEHVGLKILAKIKT